MNRRNFFIQLASGLLIASAPAIFVPKLVKPIWKPLRNTYEGISYLAVIRHQVLFPVEERIRGEFVTHYKWVDADLVSRPFYTDSTTIHREVIEHISGTTYSMIFGSGREQRETLIGHV